jgi:hypothetical protein
MMVKAPCWKGTALRGLGTTMGPPDVFVQDQYGDTSTVGDVQQLLGSMSWDQLSSALQPFMPTGVNYATLGTPAGGSTAAKSSSTMLWIVGGLGALLLIAAMSGGRR